MRVALACIRYPPAPGGAETHVAALAEGLIQRGHDVVVHASDLHTEYPFARRDLPTEVEGVRVVRHRAVRWLGAWTAMPTMPKALREEAERADVLHAHSYGYYQTVAAARASAGTGTPLVFTPHFHPPWSMEGGRLRRVLRGVYDPTLGRYALARAARVIGVSSGEVASLREHLPLDMARVRIVPNGFHAAAFDPPPSREAGRARLGAADDAPLVVFAGRLASNKGLQHLVPAFARVAQAHPRARLVVAGEDQGWGARVRAVAESLGVADRVTLTGHQDAAAYRETLAAADVFVLPSEWEAFGIVLLEAMACGVPCVATRVGGAPEVVADGETGALVAYGDEAALAHEIDALLADPARRRRMGEAGRRRALASFTWDAVVDRTVEIYREVAKARDISRTKTPG
ncbi:MAG TPA: glycosyltransferase family 4 protein [Candidatus Thermoplasmatota archaeon]|nr:glycosyltransferase family 4 protein [Candidatus Thermoplasmatota archaeon]